ncbi:MAG: hypothetical protein IJ542_02580 [Clostridia bacterium]|nr:hypothetical protein [Clostridia bacterium]
MAKTNSSIGASLWRTLGVIMLVACVAWVWNYFFVDRPQTVGSTVVNSLDSKDSQMEDATTFLNVNYWKNSDESGKELLEVGFTSYATPTSTVTVTQGLQCYDGVNVLDTSNSVGNPNYIYSTALQYTSFYRTLKKKYFSQTVTNLSYFDITQIDEDHSTAMISTSNSKTLNKTNFILSTEQEVKTTQNGVEQTTKKITPISLQFKRESSNLYKYSDYTWALISMHTNEYYDYAGIDNFMLAVEKSVKSLDAGTHYIYIDLADWFNVYLYNSEKQDYSILTADLQYTYVLMKVTVQNQGVTRDSQSMFGKIAKEDGQFDFSQSDSTPFWKFVNNYTLTNDDFTTVDYGTGKMLVLDGETLDYLSNFKNLKVSIEIDLDKFENAIAINALSLGNISYKNITITGSGTAEFTFKYALNLHADSIKASSGITVTLENSNITVGVV